MSKTVADCGGVKLPKIVIPVRKKTEKKKGAKKNGKG